MVELSTLAKYPFLKAAKNYVKDNAPSIDELLYDPLYERARLIGVERIDNAFENKDVGNRILTNDSDCIMELLSYPIARMIAVCIDDSFFKKRYALGEAIHAYKNLIIGPTSFILYISKEFKLKVKYEEISNSLYIYFTDYIHYAPTSYKKWKMTNRELSNGYIHISDKDLVRIIQEALRLRINNELEDRNCNSNVKKIFSEDIQRIRNKVLMHREKLEATPIGQLDFKKLPPCMSDILAAVQSGENVPHMGRFALVAFLNSLKLNADEILKVFSRAPDFEEEKTRYQVEHITGSSSATSYTPPGCDKMRTYGICPVEKIDALCKKINHPLSYYKAKWKEDRDKQRDKK